MKPTPHHAAAGRANPEGIAYLYLADERLTAVAECRPWVGGFVSVGQFSTAQSLNLVDFTQHGLGFLTTNNPDRQAWHDLGEAFSMPISRGDDIRDYYPHAGRF